MSALGFERENMESTELPVCMRGVTQSFLDTERDEVVVEATRLRAQEPPPLAEEFADEDSESEAGSEPRAESPLFALDEKPLEASAPPRADAEASLLDLSLPEEVHKPPAARPGAYFADEKPHSPVERLLEAEEAPLTPPSPAATSPAPPPSPAPARTEASPPPSARPLPGKAPAAVASDVMEAELIFKRMGLDAWFDPARLHPQVESLVYWRDPVRSGAALAGGLALLLALACCSLISVGAWLAVLGLAAAVAFRVYRGVLTAVRKTPDGHPFADWLQTDIRVSPERAQQLAAAAVAHLNAATEELRRLFLVEDLVDSLRFGVALWVLTYIGAAFNGITLLILGYIALFTLPKAYEANKAQVDANLDLARAKIKEITDKVRAAVPLGKKTESEKDK